MGIASGAIEIGGGGMYPISLGDWAKLGDVGVCCWISRACVRGTSKKWAQRGAPVVAGADVGEKVGDGDRLGGGPEESSSSRGAMPGEGDWPSGDAWMGNGRR